MVCSISDPSLRAGVMTTYRSALASTAMEDPLCTLARLNGLPLFLPEFFGHLEQVLRFVQPVVAALEFCFEEAKIVERVDREARHEEPVVVGPRGADDGADA